jgi:hypothetical protein
MWKHETSDGIRVDVCVGEGFLDYLGLTDSQSTGCKRHADLLHKVASARVKIDSEPGPCWLSRRGWPGGISPPVHTFQIGIGFEYQAPESCEAGAGGHDQRRAAIGVDRAWIATPPVKGGRVKPIAGGQKGRRAEG